MESKKQSKKVSEQEPQEPVQEPEQAPANQVKSVGPQPKLKPDMPLDYWKQRFQSADPNRYHQFKNKNPEKKDRMAIAAYYDARQPKANKK